MAVTLTQLRAFMAVVQAGSVHAAARQLFVSQPSVSAALAALAREVGTDLVERHGRGIRLTAAGEAYRPYAAEVLGLLEQGRDAASEAERPEHARIRLAAVNTAGEYLIPAVIQAYRRAEPGAEVLLEIGNRRSVLERVESRAADLAVAGRPPNRNVTGRAFLDNELIVVAREPAEDLASLTWLLREEGSGTRAATEAFLADREIEPREVLTLGSNGAVKQALSIGLGATLISVHAVARELRDGTLVRLPASGTPLRRPWYSLVARGVEPRPAVQRFREFLHSAAAADAIEAAL
ncbi:MAG: LysR family transcriptional regulator [Actinobacteria bacterium]|nr:MAG: LysR family transcriptional regulator [Actinomycetota bacterium]